MPARRSSSVHGSAPRDPASRSFSWQLFDREPTFTYMTSPSNVMLLATCPPSAGRSPTTTSPSPDGSSAGAVRRQRRILSFCAEYRWPPGLSTSLPPPGPNDARSSGRPSPDVSRNAITPPPPALSRALIAAYRSPFGATAISRTGPRSDPTTSAQNPSGSTRPPLSLSQGGSVPPAAAGDIVASGGAAEMHAESASRAETSAILDIVITP